MTIEEQNAELISQIACHQRELDHLREIQGEGVLGLVRNTQRAVAGLIAGLRRQLSDSPVPTDLTESLSDEAV